MQRHADFPLLQRDFGIFLPDDVQGYIPDGFKNNFDMAIDAQPALVTTSNSGIPAYLANYIDPALIRVLLTPNKAATIFGEVKKGDWTTMTTTFPVIERTGEVSSYGDYNQNGRSGANSNFPQRQSYHYQTITEWGERELDMAGLAKINWAAELNTASATILDKFQNSVYFFGVGGLQNYGLLNDPLLSAPLTPATKTAGGTSWAHATPVEVFNDVKALFAQLQLQSGGLLEMDAKMVLALSPVSAVYLANINDFRMTGYEALKINFPNIRFETATQYATAAGQLMQLIAEEVEGQETGYCAYTEKMRAHPIIRHLSSFQQKKSQGAWGSVIRQPFAIAQMLGI